MRRIDIDNPQNIATEESRKKVIAGFDATFDGEFISHQLIFRHLYFQITPPIQKFPEHVARLKGYYPSAGNHHLLTALRVPTRSRALLAYYKIPKPGNFDLLSAFQGLFDNFEYLLYNFCGFL